MYIKIRNQKYFPTDFARRTLHRGGCYNNSKRYCMSNQTVFFKVGFKILVFFLFIFIMCVLLKSAFYNVRQGKIIDNIFVE